MKITEARPARNPVKEGRGGSVGVTLGAETEPNFLICVLDDIGVEWFRQYYERWGTGWAESGTDAVDSLPVVAPWFEEMADAGLLFYDSSAAPICGPTRTGIATGRYGFRHGHNTNIRDPGGALGGVSPIGYATPSSELFLYEYIKQQKPHYATGEFAKHHMCDHFSGVSSGDAYGCPTNAPDANLSHSSTMGFDHFDIHPANIGGAYTYWRITNGVVSKIEGDLTGIFDESTYPTAVFGSAAQSWIASQGNNPWLAYVAFGPPHGLFRVPPFTMISSASALKLQASGLMAGDTVSGTVQSSSAFYNLWVATVEATDTALRRIWESLTPEVRARTYLIITGDNGTTIEGVPVGFNHSKRQIYWEGTRAPFLIVGPGVASPGERVHSIVSVHDIYDTVTDLIGVPRASSTRDSVSLVPLIQKTVDRSDINAVRDYVYVSLGTNTLMDGQDEQWAVYDGRYRVGLMAGLSSVIMTDEAEDPLETTDVSADNALRKAEMEAYKLELVGS